MNSGIGIDDLFEARQSYPDADAHGRFARLIGLDDKKERLSKLLGTLVNPAGLEAWASKHHPDASQLVDAVLRRPPLLVLAGDVGSGKTELAETIGDAVARQERIDVTLLPLSLSARGQGRVGEMTQLLSNAFEIAISEASRLSNSSRNTGAVILLIDEADALAQSRAATQMHHEDRAGVNAFIRGVDRVANSRLPLAVIMCTNRLAALDPAVRRRAAEVLYFERPDAARRRDLLDKAFSPLGFSEADIQDFVDATGPSPERGYGFTFSDLVQRLLPGVVLDAYPSSPISAERALNLARAMAPTPPFEEKES